ncbi:MAG: AIR synthase family protein [Chloroflexi bacterium]|nr:AIR synthase family protein [Chloroflexota bacterium]
MTKSPLATGKLPSELLASLLARIPQTDPRVVIGPAIGQDAAVIDMRDHYLVAKTDPITFATDDIGWYAVNVNANDIACMGAHPQWFLASVLLPEGRTDWGMAETIVAQIVEACAALRIAFVGGHTEITYGLDRPLVIGAMLGQVAKDKLVTSRGAHIGDMVFLTKSIPLEGTALIAREKETELSQRGCSDEVLSRAKKFLRDPGISVLREALIVADAGLTTAMHDPTEGGLATGLWELAQAAQVGLEIEQAQILFNQEGVELCAVYGLDPMGVIASGSLLFTARPDHAGQVTALMQNAGIACCAIGRVVPREEGITLVRDGQHQELRRFERDEIARLFD